MGRGEDDEVRPARFSAPLPAHLSSSEQADRVARHWVTRYYRTTDERDLAAIEGLYAPDARIAWNGTPLPAGPTFQQFWQAMPQCITEIQSFDAHPLPRASEQTPLSVTVSVNGRQAFYDELATDPLLKKPAVSLNHKGKGKLQDAEIAQLPRAFHQHFVLVVATDPQGQVVVDIEGQPIYVARSDAFRFVG